MILRRCAWHRSYFGRPKLLGLVAERRLRLAITDGMCERCRTRHRAGVPIVPRVDNAALVAEARRQLARESATP